jgi:hypothetical protein
MTTVYFIVYLFLYSLFYADELSGIGYAPKSGAKLQKYFDIYKF